MTTEWDESVPLLDLPPLALVSDDEPVPHHDQDTESVAALPVKRRTSRQRSGWSVRIDLRDLDETADEPRPTVGQIVGGGSLLYAGKVNGIHGASGSGKSWTALAACRDVIEAGGVAFYLDAEDKPTHAKRRLRRLGLTDEHLERFVYLRPRGRLEDAERAELLALVTDLAPSLVVIDTTGMVLAMEGLNPNQDEHVAEWMLRLPMALADLGPAVLLLDHVTKDGRGRGPIGSSRKLNAVSGVQYAQTLRTPFGQAEAGAARLVCVKDREGAYTDGEHVADLMVDPESERLLDLLSPYGGSDVASRARFRLMVALSDALAESGPVRSFNAAAGLVSGKRDVKGKAWAALLDGGHVVQTEDGFWLARPVRDRGEPLADPHPDSTGSTGREPVADQ